MAELGCNNVSSLFDKQSLFDKAKSLYLSLGYNDQEADEYATNDLYHWFGYKDNFSYKFIRF